MKNLALLPFLLFLAATTSPAAPPAATNACVVFLGDGITQQRIYTRYVMNFFALHEPGVTRSFRNAGLVGDGECDRAPGGFKRLQRDVLDLAPALAVVAFGMEDAGYRAFDQARYDDYLRNLSAITTELKGHQIKAVLMTPGCVADSFQRNGLDGAGYNALLRRYADGAMELARREGVPVADVHALIESFTERCRAAHTNLALIPDPTKPSPAIHAVMAFGLLKALGCEGPASDAVLDAAGARVLDTRRCAISALSASSNVVHFVRADRGFPVYLDPEARGVAVLLPEAAALNRYGLTVKGLAEGNWALTVAGQKVGVFTAAQWKDGIDLAASPGPWQVLGERVNAMSVAAEELYNHIWWDVKTMWWLPPEVDAERRRLLASTLRILTERDAERARIAASVQPWTWVLTKQVQP